MIEGKIKQPQEFPEKVHVIIEIPRGSENKYEVDKESGLLKLDRPLFSSIHYPGDYGYVPNTLWDDGDPIDILVLTNHPVYPLTLAKVRVIGMLDMQDGDESDAKILGVYDTDPRYFDYRDLKDIEKHKLKEIIHFFESYKHLQGKSVKIAEVKGKKDAQKAILKSKKNFEQKYGII
ncbi:inorganic diphosphatase [Candidatus Pacearchaeota archaeon]|nr:inorganic diphosphatase [Candidatus Pacearchaeota archaeon]